MAVTEIVNFESQRLQRILDDFLAFARLPVAVLVEGDLKTLMEQTIELVGHDPRFSEEITINRRYDDNPPCCFDPDLMRQVLLNLFLNAVQAMPGNGELTIQMRQNGKKLNVSMTDNGNGIPEAMMTEVSKPFFTGRQEGSGLGLSIVQRILAQHGTALGITSQEGSGTEVAFELEIIS